MAVDGQRFMTKTQHYRKVTKPLLERKRRARMNLYLDELKDLIVDTMEAQGEHVTKLEKADILEMTVNYLKTHKRKTSGSQSSNGGASRDDFNVEKFRAGYTQAAYEVSKVFSTLPSSELKFGSRLMKHLGYQLKDFNQTTANEISPQPSSGEEGGLKSLPHSLPYSPHRRNSESEADFSELQVEDVEPKTEDVWRPW